MGQHLQPAFRTFWGQGAIDALPRELDRVGARRAAVFCGASLVREGALLARVESALGGRFAGRFDGVREHSPVPAVVAGAGALRDARADAVVAVGGGSAVVSARAAAILLAEGRDLRELCTRRGADGRLVSPRLDAPKLPQFVVATTPSTAYAKAGSAVRDPDAGERLALFDPKTRAQAVFLDAGAAATAPAAVVEGAGLNALAMAVEALGAPQDDPLADAALRQSLVLLARWLPRLRTPDGARARVPLMLAALLAGQGTDHKHGGLAGSLSHALGPRSAVSNGHVEAILLPHAVRFNAPATGARMAAAAASLGAATAADADDDADAPARTADALERLLAALPVPRRLRDAGVDRGLLDDVAAHATDDWFLQRNPRPVGAAELRALLEAAW